MKITTGTRGPHDDFYCHKYEVWYRVDDCVFRGANKTFPGCVDCFQGRLNMRSLERGIRPPAFLGPETPSGSPAPQVRGGGTGSASGALIQRLIR